MESGVWETAESLASQAQDPKIAPSFEPLPLQPLCKDQRELFQKKSFLWETWKRFSEETKPDFCG